MAKDKTIVEAVEAVDDANPIGAKWEDHPWIALKPDLAGRVFRCSASDKEIAGSKYSSPNSTAVFTKHFADVGMNTKGMIKGTFWVLDEPFVT